MPDAPSPGATGPDPVSYCAAMAEPFLSEHDSEACWVCPALRLPAGWFDVYERPTSECPFEPQSGFRYAGAIPVCVHPHKVGLPAGRYASEGLGIPGLPDVPPRPAPVAPIPAPEPSTPPADRAEPPVDNQALDDAIMAGTRPEVPDALLSLLRGLVGGAAPDQLESVLARAEETARRSHDADVVLEALRRVLGGG